jgi:hypothetical protein
MFPRSAAVAYLDLGRAVRGIDFLLRQRQGIHEFTNDEHCIFRISFATADRDLILSDGTEVRKGDQIIQLHLWNEHMLSMPHSPSAAWASRMKWRTRHSLAMLAAYLDGEPSLDAVRAVKGAPSFASRLGALQMVRTAQRFGFDVIDPEAPLEWRERVHAMLDSMLLWGLAYAFTPGGLRANKGLLRHRYQLWISRRKLLLCYGLPGLARAYERS